MPPRSTHPICTHKFGRRSFLRPIEALETRQLLSASNTADIGDVLSSPGSSQTVDLSAFIDDPAVNSQIKFATELGDITFELFDQTKPITVANFLQYVRTGRLDTSIIHRATEPSSGLEVLQGGGYAPPSFQHIETSDLSGTGIQNEASIDPVLSNSRGTISMARTSDPNSATSEFFINVVDNTNLDPAAQPPGYAVFGQVTGNSLAVVDAIAALPTFAFNSPFGEIPLRNYTQNDFDTQVTPTASNFISITAETIAKLTFEVQSSDPTAVSAAVVGNKLTLTFGSQRGSAEITVTGTDGQNNSVSQTFTASTGLEVTLGTTAEAQSAVFTDADGTTSTITYKGAGTASVIFDGTGLAKTVAKKKATVTGTGVSATAITITGGAATDTITISGKGGDARISLGGFTTDSGLKSLSAKTVNATGTFSFTGPVGKIDLGNATDLTLNIGGADTDKPGAITLGTGTGVAIASNMPLKSVTATTLAPSSGTTATITAPSLDSLTVKGDMTQNVDVVGGIKKLSVTGNLISNLGASTVGSIAVKGSIANSSIVVDRPFAATEKPLGKVTVGGAITGSVFSVTGNITSVAAASMSDSTIFAGVASTVDPATLPSQSSDFAALATIASVKIKTTTANSNIAAANLGKLSLGTVTTSNSGTAFGLSADKITTLVATAGAGKVNLKKIETQADVTTQTTGLTLEDFAVTAV